MLRATTACTFSTSQLPKVVRPCGVLYIFTCKCASRHNGVHFVDIATSKSGPRLVCFVHFEMCFAPQRRALFRHRNFKKWSEVGVFCTFWLGNVLRATTACTFSTSQLQKVVRGWCVLYILTWKCASRHNGVHFSISHLANRLRTRRFSEPTFPPSGATNYWKNTVNRDFQCFTTFLPFRASASSFFWLFLFSDLLSSELSLLSASSLLCFSSVHTVGSLASKLPSINGYKWRFIAGKINHFPWLLCQITRLGISYTSGIFWDDEYNYAAWWWLEHGFMTFQKQLGISWNFIIPCLTSCPSFFRGVGQPPTRYAMSAIPLGWCIEYNWPLLSWLLGWWSDGIGFTMVYLIYLGRWEYHWRVRQMSRGPEGLSATDPQKKRDSESENGIWNQSG